LKVCLLISGSLENVSGGYLYDRMLVEHLRDAGHMVNVYCLSGQTYPGRLLENFKPATINKIIEEQPDILLEDELEHAALFHRNQALKQKLTCPIISIVHHLRFDEPRPAWQNRLYRIVERRYLQSADGFIFCSQATKTAVHRLCGKQKPEIVSYPCGNPGLTAAISREKIIERAGEPGPLRLVFVGNVIRRKRLHDLIKAISRLNRETCRLTVIGSLSEDTFYVNKVRRMIASKGLKNSVSFMGRLPDQQVISVLESSHLLAMPSSHEGFGIVYLEGMGFGLPAIGSSSGGAVELIEHGVNGFLVTPGDVVSLAQYIRELALDRQRLADMANQARERYLRHPGWTQTCGNITSFLESLVSRHPASE